MRRYEVVEVGPAPYWLRHIAPIGARWTLRGARRAARRAHAALLTTLPAAVASQVSIRIADRRAGRWV